MPLPDGASKIKNFIALNYRSVDGEPMAGVGYKIKFEGGASLAESSIRTVMPDMRTYLTNRYVLNTKSVSLRKTHRGTHWRQCSLKRTACSAVESQLSTKASYDR